MSAVRYRTVLHLATRIRRTRLAQSRVKALREEVCVRCQTSPLVALFLDLLAEIRQAILEVTPGELRCKVCSKDVVELL